jgi:hypothetical protein
MEAVFHYLDKILPITAPVSLVNEEITVCTVFIFASLQLVVILYDVVRKILNLFSNNRFYNRVGNVYP